MTSIKEAFYYTFDLPLPYKKLLLHPVKIRDFMEFATFSNVLMFEKNSIKDPEMAIKAISMTYLEYVWFLAKQEPMIIKGYLDGLLRLVLNVRENKDFRIDYGILKDGSNRPFFKIEGEIYDSSDFDELRKLIAEQNMIELPDETIQKDVREKMEEVKKFKEKINKSKVASFEEQLLSISLFSGWTLEEVYNMTYRKFVMSIRRANHIIMSNIYLTASMSGMVTFKDKSVLRSWLVDLSEKDKFEGTMINTESVENKLNFNEAKQDAKKK